jgi:hypothetical protein
MQVTSLDANGERLVSYLDVYGEEANEPIAGSKAVVDVVRAAEKASEVNSIDHSAGSVDNNGGGRDASKADMLRRWASLGAAGRRKEALQQIQVLDTRSSSWASAICKVRKRPTLSSPSLPCSSPPPFI